MGTNKARNGRDRRAAEAPRTRPDDERLPLEVERRLRAKSVQKVEEIGFHAIDLEWIALEVQTLEDEGELEVLSVSDPDERG
jgi:hypothetical protein